ncbi:hypothetical protein [Methylosinus sp. RM1]|nr:hypothetical protein [Methylosinus sp. RM1]
MKIAADLSKRFVAWYRRVDWKRHAEAGGFLVVLIELIRKLHGGP